MSRQKDQLHYNNAIKHLVKELQTSVTVSLDEESKRKNSETPNSTSTTVAVYTKSDENNTSAMKDITAAEGMSTNEYISSFFEYMSFYANSNHETMIDIFNSSCGISENNKVKHKICLQLGETFLKYMTNNIVSMKKAIDYFKSEDGSLDRIIDNRCKIDSNIEVNEDIRDDICNHIKAAFENLYLSESAVFSISKNYKLKIDTGKYEDAGEYLGIDSNDNELKVDL